MYLNVGFLYKFKTYYIYDSYDDFNRILLKMTDVLFSRKLLFLSKETNAHKGKFLRSGSAFCVFWYLCTDIFKVFN